MNVNFNKLIGWVVFFVGLGIIFYSISSSFNILTGKKLAPEVFRLEEEEISLSEKQSGTIEEIIRQTMAEELKEFLPTNVIPKMLNFAVWTILASFLVLAGAQISGLGIKLLKS